MKQFYRFLILFLSTFFVQAQVINIPDANFKNALVNTLCVNLNGNFDSQGLGTADADTNDNGEIELSEALAVEKLTLTGQSISSLSGIENFTNLKVLSFDDNMISSVDVSTMTTLRILMCPNNQLASLDVSMLPNLFVLHCEHNLITTLNMFTNGEGMMCSLNCNNNLLTSLDLKSNIYDTVNCTFNNLTNIDLSTVPYIWESSFANNQFSTLIIPSTAQIGYINISDNPLTSFVLDGQQELLYLTCVNTLLTSLDLSKLNVSYLSIVNNPNLQFLNLRNGHLNGNTGDQSLEIESNAALEYVCIDDLVYSLWPEEGFSSEYIKVSSVINNPNVNYTYYCSLTPVGEYNTVTGNIKFDCGGINSNLPGTRININSPDGATYSGGSGNFSLFHDAGNVVVAPQFQNPYYTVSPPSYSFNFVGTGNMETADFCISPNGFHPDLEVAIVPQIPARPGFDAKYSIVYTNKGTETQSGSVALNFDDAVFDLISATPTADSQSLNTLSWNFSGLAPFETRTINITLNVNSPVETPAVSIGDILTLNAQIATAETDETPNNNTSALLQTVVGSYDPNDKTVSRESILVSEIGNDLYYTVHFQNTGTFYAENVVIRDVLSNNLDLSTLEMVASSHLYRSRLDTSTRKLEVFFEGIDLPASAGNEPASHGFITFKVKPENTVALEDEIKNTAEIYFDFNSAIVTNTVSTTVSQLGTDDFATVNFSLYPNPVKNILTIQLESNIIVKSVSIFNTLGQLVKILPNTFEDSTITADVSDLNTATYFVQVISDQGKTSKKLIKL
jgi:uncharacterized repeat protein (TIGR01451 family)